MKMDAIELQLVHHRLDGEGGHGLVARKIVLSNLRGLSISLYVVTNKKHIIH